MQTTFAVKLIARNAGRYGSTGNDDFFQFGSRFGANVVCMGKT